MMTGAMRSTPISAMETVTGLQPLKDRQEIKLPIMCIKMPGVADKGCQLEPERKSLTLEYVDIKYPEEQWTHSYTDGSAAEATRDGGGGVYIRYNDVTAQITIATGKYSTNFKAEAEALKKSCN